jgi:Na+/H+ antiporter NhaB
MAIYANIPIDQGSSFSSVITVNGADGLAFNLTGYTVRGQIRKSYAATTYTAFNCAVQSGVVGKIQITLTAAQTAALKPGRYLYDIEIVETSSGAITRVVEGQVDVSPRVTRV